MAVLMGAALLPFAPVARALASERALGLHRICIEPKDTANSDRAKKAIAYQLGRTVHAKLLPQSDDQAGCRALAH